MFSGMFAWHSKYVSVETLSSKLTQFAIAGLITAIVAIVKKEWSWSTAPLSPILRAYSWKHVKDFRAAVSWHCLSSGSAYVWHSDQESFLYKYNVIPVTDNFRAIVATTTFDIAIVYVVNWRLSWFGGDRSFRHSGGVVGLLVSLFVVTIAVLNLLLDFDLIAKGSNRGLPSHMG
jgi:uncharacterized YccA/Bax inhibitor family protein